MRQRRRSFFGWHVWESGGWNSYLSSDWFKGCGSGLSLQLGKLSPNISPTSHIMIKVNARCFWLRVRDSHGQEQTRFCTPLNLTGSFLALYPNESGSSQRLPIELEATWAERSPT